MNGILIDVFARIVAKLIRTLKLAKDLSLGLQIVLDMIHIL